MVGKKEKLGYNVVTGILHTSVSFWENEIPVLLLKFSLKKKDSKGRLLAQWIRHHLGILR